MNNRIAQIDGLRALAALGVLWIHCWTSFGNPRLVIYGLDFASVLALGGNGVDLFFVISGFCMYYFYALKKDFSYPNFQSFIYKRWKRLSPAFYLITVIYIIHDYQTGSSDLAWLKFCNSLFYLNSIFPHFNAESLLWTLGVEWQFYLIFPFVLIYQKRIGFKYIFLIVLVWMTAISIVSVLVLKERSDLLTQQIFFRYFEFMWGILVARIILFNPLIIKQRLLFLIAAIIITYIGRAIISHPVLTLSTNYYNLFKLVGFTTMGMGFSAILYLVLTSKKHLLNLLSNRVMRFVGLRSYSFYLLHGLILSLVVQYLRLNFSLHNAFLLSITAFLISTILLIPLSSISYNVLEKPFMSSKKN